MQQQKKIKLSNYYSDVLKASCHFKQKNWDEASKHPTPILAVWTISATFAPC